MRRARPHDKVLTERARAAVQRLHEQGIRFAITSGRPPRGMVMLTDPLRIDTAIAAFNGGIFVEPDLTVIDSHALPPKVSETAVRLVAEHGLDVWVYGATSGSCVTLTARTSPASNGP